MFFCEGCFVFIPVTHYVWRSAWVFLQHPFLFLAKPSALQSVSPCSRPHWCACMSRAPDFAVHAGGFLLSSPVVLQLSASSYQKEMPGRQVRGPGRLIPWQQGLSVGDRWVLVLEEKCLGSSPIGWATLRYYTSCLGGSQKDWVTGFQCGSLLINRPKNGFLLSF